MVEHYILMARAIELALENVKKQEGGPFAAIIVKDGEIVGIGTNQVTTLNDPTAHAEINAIRDACKKLKTHNLDKCEIYTTCEPCPMCLGAIYWARLRKIYYAATREDAAAIRFDDEVIYQELARPINERSIPAMQILHDEAIKIFEAWEQDSNKIMY